MTSLLKDPGAVEVRKTGDSYTWFEARMIDVDLRQLTVKVSFAAENWQPRVVPASLVRKPGSSTASFDPKVGDLADVRIAGSWDSPPGWSRGRVRSIKGDFFFMTFEDASSGARDLIVEKDALRPVCNQPSLDLSKLERALVPIEAQLRHWAGSEDALQSSLRSRSVLA
jgi:hypothetical protein